MQAVRDRVAGGPYHLHEAGALVTITSANGARADLSGIDGVRVTYREGSLEDVFLALTGRELRDE
jgi:hypothetical protein